MDGSPRSSRSVAAALLTACVALAVLLGACGSDGEEGGGDTTTSVTAPGTSVSTSPSSSTTGGGESTTSTGPLPTSPSTLPPFDGPCDALAQTLGLDEIRPIDSSSWIDERQRIVVDAQREAQLLASAQQGAPSDIAVRLATMEAYAAFVASAVGNADSYASATASLDGYPDSVGVTQAEQAVSAWRATACG